MNNDDHNKQYIPDRNIDLDFLKYTQSKVVPDLFQIDGNNPDLYINS